MADFRPTSTIYCFTGTRVDRQNQPFFKTPAAKVAWYMGQTHVIFNNYSWQRENNSYFIRVERRADMCRDFDMLMYQNDPADRWMICRITEISFINPNVTQINYEIDWFQTSMGYIEFRDCWIEREMQSNDWNGGEPSWNNLQPEGLEGGIMTRTPNTAAMTAAGFNKFTLVVLSQYDEDGMPNYDVVSLSNYPTGLNRITFSIPENGSMPGLNRMLKTYADKGIDLSTAIVGMFICPSDYVIGANVEKNITVTPNWSSIAGVQIVNAKCFTSEFFGLEISNRRGNSVELKMEQFTETGEVLLRRLSSFGEGSGGSLLYPVGYEGFSPDFGVMLYNDMQSPFVSNAFSSWLSSNIASVGASAATDAIAGAQIGAAVGGPHGAVIGGIAGLGFSALKIFDKHKDPAALGGQVAGAVFQLQSNFYGFSICWVHPRAANIRSIDQYFSRYGYRTNRLKKPNVDTRPHWNYVKTAGAVVGGPIGMVAREEIEAQMDKGVTFWHVNNGITIGDYSDPMGNRE